MKLSIRAFALAFGLWWGGAVFLMTWWLIVISDVKSAPMMLDQFYMGYSITPLGSLVGLGYGLVDGAIGGAILAWLYNFFAARFHTGDQNPAP